MATIKRQSGAAMMIALVVVAAVSLIAVAGMQDTNTQANMVRNEQLYTSAYQVALSEINAQLDALNLNDSNELDNNIIALLSYDVGTFTDFDMTGPEAGDGAFNQELTQAALCDLDDCTSPPGYSIGESTRVLRAEINSVANFPGAISSSDQTQGYWYLLPSAGGKIVSW